MTFAASINVTYYSVRIEYFTIENGEMLWLYAVNDKYSKPHWNNFLCFDVLIIKACWHFDESLIDAIVCPLSYQLSTTPDYVRNSHTHLSPKTFSGFQFHIIIALPLTTLRKLYLSQITRKYSGCRYCWWKCSNQKCTQKKVSISRKRWVNFSFKFSQFSVNGFPINRPCSEIFKHIIARTFS